MEVIVPFLQPKAEGTAEVRRNGVIVWADGTEPITPPPPPQEDADQKPASE